MNLHEAAKAALNAWEYDSNECRWHMDNLRAALAAEPDEFAKTMGGQFALEIASIWHAHPDYSIRQTLDALNARFPKRPLTDEQIDALPCTDGDGSDRDALLRFARAVERAHGIGEQS